MLQAALIGQLLKLGLFVGGGIFLFRFFGKKVDENRQQNADKTFSENAAQAQAVRIYTTFNQSGFKALRNLDGTNVAALLTVAREIKDFQAVVTAYNTRYNRSLNDDLNKELSAEDLAKFYALAGAPNNSKVNYQVLRDGIEKSQWVQTRLETNIRSTPKKTGHFEYSNVIKTIPPYKLIGLTTGKTELDQENDIIYIEIKSGLSGKVRYGWVAKSQVELIPMPIFEQRRKQGEKFTLALLTGIEDEHPQLATRKVTTIYDDNQQPVSKIRDRVLLGYPLAYVNTLKGVFVCFLAPDGKRYWCSASAIFLVLPEQLRKQLSISTKY